MTAPILATRVRKARAQSVCALCTAIIRIGAQIGRLPGTSWCHSQCIIDANRLRSAADSDSCSTQ